MSNNGFVPTPRVKNAFDIAKLKLVADTPNAQGSKSTLQLTLINNNPRFIVYTNDPAEKDDKTKNFGKITANLDQVVLATYWQLLKDAINSPIGQKVRFAIENKGHKYFGKERSAEPVVLNTLWVGKDEDGKIWTLISEKGRPQIRFDFVLPSYHRILNGDGTQLSVADESRMVANGWMELMGRLMVVMMADNYVEPPPRDQQGGGRGNFGGGGGNRGGYNNNRGGNSGGGSYQGGANNSSGTDDDIPF